MGKPAAPEPVRGAAVDPRRLAMLELGRREHQPCRRRRWRRRAGLGPRLGLGCGGLQRHGFGRRQGPVGPLFPERADIPHGRPPEGALIFPRPALAHGGGVTPMGSSRNSRPGDFIGPARDFGLGPAAPIDIGPQRPLDGAARVLGHHQAAHRIALAVGGLDIDRGAQRQEGRIHRQAAPRRERRALAADGVGARQLAEEDVARVLLHQRLGLAGMGQEPGPEALQRHLLGGDLAALDQDPADGDIAPAIGRGDADAHALSVGKGDLGRALDGDEEGVDRAGEPDQLEAPPGQGPGIDLRPAIGAGIRGLAIEGHGIARLGAGAIPRPAAGNSR